MDLLQFDQLSDSTHNHRAGQIITYNNTLLAIGGEVTAEIELLIDNQWELSEIPPVGNVNIPLFGFSALLVNNNITIFGGYRRGPAIYKKGILETNAVWSYDQSHKVWIPKSLLRRPRTYHKTVMINDKIYHFDGCYHFNAISERSMQFQCDHSR